MALRLALWAGVVTAALVAPGLGLADKRIALTFDDAPRADGQVFTGAERAGALLEALASVDSGPVAFFVTTQGIATEADGAARIARYAAAGHLIANHTHSHRWAHRTPIDDYLADIDRAHEALREVDNYRPWFRFPFLDEGRDAARIEALAKGLAARGLANGYVTVDNYDWYLDQALQNALADGRTVDYEALGKLYVRMLSYAAEFYDSLAVQMLGESPVHVLLLHENDLAALYVDDLVVALRRSGWTIVSPDLAYADPLPAPRTRFTSQGRVFGLAADAGRARNTMWTWAIDEQMLDLMLARSKAFGAADKTPQDTDAGAR
ncbi:MAG: polysaccharide deacetylase family protein [Pseudomonadota bacterium]